MLTRAWMQRIRIIAVIGLIAVLGGWALPVGAVDYQEDPGAAKTVYSGLSLLLYYSDSLDPVLQADPVLTGKVLSIMPLANIPRELENATRSFAASGIDLAGSLAGLFSLWQEENQLVNHYRLEEANVLAQQLSSGLLEARDQLTQLTAALQYTGTYLKVDSAAPQSELNKTYLQVQDKVDRLEQMLDLLHRPLAVNGPLKPVILSLEISPLEVFVGDEIEFSGALSSGGGPLGDRQVEILLNHTDYTMLRTDAGGQFRGKVEIPFWYLPQIAVQAVCYPRGDDVGRYMGTSSPVVNLAVRYYQADLTIRADGPGYPGRDIRFSGSFDYGPAPPADRKRSELYFDDQQVQQFTAAPSFTQSVSLDPATQLGEHAVTLSVPADGRYAPAHAACVMKVTQAAITLDLNTSTIGWIPGRLQFGGRLHSEFGPLSGSAVNISVDRNRRQVTSAPDGSITAGIDIPLSLSLLGSQAVTLEVHPAEPWNAPLTLTRNIFMVNIVNCAVILTVILFLVFYLPRRFKKRFGAYPARSPGAAVTPVYTPVPARAGMMAPDTESREESDKTADSVFQGYRLVLKLVQAATRVFLKPHQTLREYAQENSRVLGPLGQPFLEFTLLIEKILYSAHKPDVAEIARSRELSRTIREESRNENV
jgi:hypothetical protein